MTTTRFSPLSLKAASAIAETVRFDTAGLIAAIAQSAETPYEVLMLAWMNAEALIQTLTTGKACYYSRSRKTLWRKGETSGQQQALISAALDCDRDAICLRVIQQGVACHTGRRSCFYLDVTPQGLAENAKPLISPETLYGRASHSNDPG